MAIFFNQRWLRFFSDAGLPVKGNEKVVFYQTYRYPDSSQAFVGFERTNPDFFGTKQLRSTHLTLSALFRNMGPIAVFAYLPKSHHDIAQILIDTYGLPLEKEWFVDQPITQAQLSNMPFVITLKLNNVLWCASDEGLQVTVKEPTVDIAERYTSTVLTTPTLPYAVVSGRTNVELISIGTDFTPLYMDDYATLLSIASSADLSSAIMPNVERADVLIRLLGDRLKIPCTRLSTITPGELSTFGSTFIYNGPASGYPTADTRYSRVLVFDVVGTTYQGRFYLHYNNLV